MRRLIIPAIAAFAAAGCQRSEYTFAEVQGNVTRGGKAQPGVLVSFWPDVNAGTRAPRATAVTDASGHYHLKCDEGTNGAVIGRYRVCLKVLDFKSRSASVSPKVPPGAKPISGPPASITMPPPAVAPLPETYASFRDTPLRDIDVKAEGVQTFDFDVPPAKN